MFRILLTKDCDLKTGKLGFFLFLELNTVKMDNHHYLNDNYRETEFNQSKAWIERMNHF